MVDVNCIVGGGGCVFGKCYEVVYCKSGKNYVNRLLN